MANETVLVIEDNFDNLELVRFVLSQAGFAVLSATDGRSGLSAAREKLPDLVLLDLSIPEMDGWQVAAQLKGDPATAHICVVALTGHTLPGDRQRAFDSGCDGYISKPLDLPNFVGEIQALLQQSQARRS
ncbi:MAG: response regulator [Chloroflexi bacterium]|jgi:two-component system cell cycle response regulator DivK|nr:response regulator [Chloroflexota bacterium]